MGSDAPPPFNAWRSYAIAADVAAATFADDAGLSARRKNRLDALLAAAGRNSPLYRRMLRDRDTSTLALQQLPIMHKAELMSRFDDWVGDPELRLDALRSFIADPARIGEPFLGRYTVWESSGSSGEPGSSSRTAPRWRSYDALEALRGRRFGRCDGWIPGACGERIAFVGAIGGHFASIASIERLRRLNPVLATRNLHGIFASCSRSPELVDRFNALAPTIVATYPSAACCCVEVRLPDVCASNAREIWTGGETFSPALRRFVQ